MTADADALDPRPTRRPSFPLSAVATLLGVSDPGGDVVLSGVSLGSTDVRPGDLYAALPGARTHGARFADEAEAAGAVAVLTDPAGRADLETTTAPVLVVREPRARLGEVSAAVYGRPSEALTTIGITGTQGKTTSTYLAESALRASGATPAVVGTTGTRIDGRPVRSALTTPEAPQLHALFAVMVEHGVTACAMEVSSHALVQGRADGVVFDVAVFLNLGRDHLDFHRDLDDYFDAKAMLFTPEHARVAVIDVDGEHGRRLAERTTLPTVTVSPSGHEADWRVTQAHHDPLGSTVTVLGPDGRSAELRVPLPGDFNVANALAVTAALVAAGYPLPDVATGIGACPGVPGRMQRVDAGQPWTAVVDYAHKPDALVAVLDALRPLTEDRLLLVIGAGGDRDTGKRPLMGAIAAERCDVVVVTDDNPRSEDPAAIRAAIVTGAESVDGRAMIVETGDRRTAIEQAVAMAGVGDVLVVAGKGHERGQEVAGVVHPFDDAVVLRSAIEAAQR